MRVLVTGAAGMLGQRVVAEATTRGWSVSVTPGMIVLTRMSGAHSSASDRVRDMIPALDAA